MFWGMMELLSSGRIVMLSKQQKSAVIADILAYPKAQLDGYFRGLFLYVTRDGLPLCRLRRADNNRWYFAIYLWSSERYSEDEFGSFQEPLPLREHLDFAVRVMPGI